MLRIARRIQAQFNRLSLQQLLKLTHHSPDNVKEFIFISNGQACLTLGDVTNRLSLNVGKKTTDPRCVTSQKITSLIHKVPVA
jgi:hypothetical protein